MKLRKEKFVPAPPLVGIHPNPGPRPRKHLSEEKRWEIVFMWKRERRTPYKIAKTLQVSYNSVNEVIKKYQETGTVHDRPHPGRKRKLSPAETKAVVQLAKKRKFAPEIARSLDNKVVDRTIQRTLKKEGFFYGKVVKVERLTEVHKATRVRYCEEMKDFDWSTVLFSDEKSFVLGSRPGYAWQKSENRIVEEYVNHAPKLHVWGAIGSHMKSKLFCFQENLNSELYQRILRQHLDEKKLIYAPRSKTRLARKWQFLQDNSRVHTAKKSMKVLKELVGNRIIPHPAKSPDLNPIENMWSYLDRKVKEAKVTTIPGLKRVLQREWKKLPWAEVRKSVDSMEQRTQLCREAEGERIPY